MIQIYLLIKKDTRKSVFSFLLLSSTIRTSSISYKEQIHTFILTICKNIIFCYRYFTVSYTHLTLPTILRV